MLYKVYNIYLQSQCAFMLCMHESYYYWLTVVVIKN